MKIADAFTRINKIISAYGKLAAVVLRVESGKLSVLGINKHRAFGYDANLDEKVGDFTFITTPEELQPILSFVVTDINVKEGNLIASGTIGTDNGSPIIKITCKPAIPALIKETEALEKIIRRNLEETIPEKKLCNTEDVLKPWLSLAKCGSKRIFLTTDLTYALSPSAAAFYPKNYTYKNLPSLDSMEPIQAEGSFPIEIQALVSMCDVEDLGIYAINEGKVFIAVSDNKSIFALSCALVPQKNTFKKAQSMSLDASSFSKVTLLQSAVRDVLLTSADKLHVEIKSGDGEISFASGAVGKIKADTVDFDCECGVAREHTTLALRALPISSELEFGFGESNGQTFALFCASGVNILIPAQDITEV